MGLSTFNPPNVFLGLLRVAAWLLWRPPMATSTRPTPPRKPVLFFVQGPVPDEVVAVLRFSYFRRGRARKVEEYPLYDEEGAIELLHTALGSALGQGADVSVITPYDFEELGLQDLMAA